MTPWESWTRGWLKLGRPWSEFWASSPAQVIVTFESNDMIERKGTSSMFLAAVGASGLRARIERVPSPGGADHGH